MTDIVERLRWTISADTPARYPEIVTEAANEIERLRSKVASLEKQLDRLQFPTQV